MVARVQGLQAAVVLPENVSLERRQLLEIFGAEVIASPGDEGTNGAIRMAQTIWPRRDDVAFLYQYGNPANPGPTTRAPARDLAGLPRGHPLRRRPRHERHADGRGRYLKERKPEVQIVAVEPPAGELVQGLRNLDDGFVPIFDPGCWTESSSCSR